MAGPLVLAGGEEFSEGCDFDRDVVAPAGRVVVLTTAAAFENPAKLADRARAWFGGLGVDVDVPDANDRRSASTEAVVRAVAGAAAVYLTSGSAQHLRSVLKGSPLWPALVGAWQRGAVLAGSQAGAAVLGATMIDARGGGFTAGLGLFSGFAVMPRFNQWNAERIHRVRTLAPDGVVVIAVDERTALVHRPGSGWSAEGAGRVEAFHRGQSVGLASLPDPAAGAGEAVSSG
jgi:cyanophycinase